MLMNNELIGGEYDNDNSTIVHVPVQVMMKIRAREERIKALIEHEEISLLSGTLYSQDSKDLLELDELEAA